MVEAPRVIPSGAGVSQEGFKFVETLTGFKWMGNVTAQLRAEGVERAPSRVRGRCTGPTRLLCAGKTVMFAFEEAIGFCVGDVVKARRRHCAAVYRVNWSAGQGWRCGSARVCRNGNDFRAARPDRRVARVRACAPVSPPCSVWPLEGDIRRVRSRARQQSLRILVRSVVVLCVCGGGGGVAAELWRARARGDQVQAGDYERDL